MELVELTDMRAIKVVSEGEVGFTSRLQEELFDTILLAQNLSLTVWCDKTARKIILRNEAGLNSRAVSLELPCLVGLSTALEFVLSLKNVSEWIKNANSAQADILASVTAETASLGQTPDTFVLAQEDFDFSKWRPRAIAIGNDLCLTEDPRRKKQVIEYRRKVSYKCSPFVTANYLQGVPRESIRKNSGCFIFAKDDAEAVAALCQLILNDEKIYANWLKKGKPSTDMEVVQASNFVSN